MIISGSSDSTVRVWDVESGEMVSDVDLNLILPKCFICDVELPLQGGQWGLKD